MYSCQELVAATPNSRDWFGILISILVILSIIGIVALVIEMHPPDDSQALSRKQVLIDDIVTGAFTPNKVDAAWISGKPAVLVITSNLSCYCRAWFGL